MITPNYSTLGAVLKRALQREHGQQDPVADVFGAAAEGIVRAAALLSESYTLVATNVPYIGNRKQGDQLRAFLDQHYPEGKADLATAFVERCREFTVEGGTYALVTPQSWLFQRAYTRLRSKLLSNQEWILLVKLGEWGFRSTAAAGAFTALCILSNKMPSPLNSFPGIDVSGVRVPREKAASLPSALMIPLSQASQVQNPEARVTLSDAEKHLLLDTYAIAPQGIKTGDDDRFVRRFWELPQVTGGWQYYQSTVEEITPYGGRSLVIDWRAEGKNMVRPRLGNRALGRRGVAVSQMRRLPATLYTGEKYDSNVAVIVPLDCRHLAALWEFCSSSAYHEAIRRIDQKIGVTNATLLMVPFDVDHWRRVAEEAGPLPEPHSNDPTQWLNKGDPAASLKPLQVAVARLLGYKWPDHQPDCLDKTTDRDGIVCLPAVLGEQPAAERFRSLLVTAFGDSWSADLQANLLAAVECTGKSLHDWLLDAFFDQHCRLFHNRPFIWHIWDGRKDGFSALVNYHKLDGANLDRLIYSYLGSWVERQRADRDADVPGAEGRLVAALELQDKLRLIREGEAPYDIYVRWKPLEEQPIGWNPDLNDGVRLNIRPFVLAGVLRHRFTIHWKKDKGKNLDGSERMNDIHLTLAEKRAARQRQVGKAAGQ